MQTTSQRYRDTVSGSHKAISRAVLCTTPQFGPAPIGTELPILAGDVLLSATADVKATLDLTVPGDYWDLLRPYGAEVFAERGIDYGDGTREMVPLGYFRITRAVQDSAPSGPVVIDGSDRIAGLRRNRVLFPIQVVDGTTHRQIFHRLVNGDPERTGVASSVGYGIFLHTIVPITWERAGYDPDTATLTGGQVVEDSAYEFLAKIADARGCVLRFLPTGELSIEQREPAPDAPVAYRVRGGESGTLVKASRAVSDDAVYNIVVARGSDPAAVTGYRVAYNDDRNSPLWWQGSFGAAPRYYASPLLRTSDQADEAARTILARYTGLPEETSVFLVPDPSLQPLDVVTNEIGGVSARHIADTLRIPLAGQDPVEVKCRTVNGTSGIVSETDYGTDPGDGTPTGPGTPPVTTPGGGTTDPGTDPGTTPGDADDGVQAAVLLNWGPVIDGDEFTNSGAPLAAKWGMYDGPGHDNNGLRRPSAFNVADGILTCTGDNVSGGTTGGMAFKRDQKYWRVEWRMRTGSINPSGGGNRYHPVLLFWPTSDQWPAGGELDFVELDCDSGKLEWFIHYPNHTPKVQEGGSIPKDIENWHNYAMEWSKDRIRAWVDGVQYFDYTQSNIQPPGPMHPTIQLDNFFGSNMAPARMQAKWFRVYGSPA